MEATVPEPPAMDNGRNVRPPDFHSSEERTMTWLPRRTQALLAAFAIAVVPIVGVTTSTAPPRAAVSHKVLWITMENHSYSGVIGKPTIAPYINNTLLHMGGNATNMHSETHPSLPNYIAMATGSTHGVADDNAPVKHPITGPSLFSQVDPSWRAYEEIMPLPCRQFDTPFTANTQYAVRHNPPAYLVSPPIGAPNADCTSNDVPLGTTSTGKFLTALNTGALKKFSYVTPGICHDMHNAPAGSTCVPTNVVTAGDNWLKVWMPKIFASSDYTSGALSVFITWDEGGGGASIKGMDCQSAQYLDDAGCHIPTLVFSTGTTAGSSDNTYFDHYSMIRTAEELLGLSTSALGPNVSGATSMRTAFTL